MTCSVQFCIILKCGWMKFRQIAGHQSPSEGVRGGRRSRIGRVSGGVTWILQLEFGFRFQINPRVFCCCTAFLPAHPSSLGFRLRVLCFHCFNSVTVPSNSSPNLYCLQPTRSHLLQPITSFNNIYQQGTWCLPAKAGKLGRLVMNLFPWLIRQVFKC